MSPREILIAQGLAESGLSRAEADRIMDNSREYSSIEVLAAMIVRGEARGL